MNKRLEQMALERFPEEWKPSRDSLCGEVDINYEARQKWLRSAQEIYNLALQDVKKAIAEEEALRAYPVKEKIIGYKNGPFIIIDINYEERIKYQESLENKYQKNLKK